MKHWLKKAMSYLVGMNLAYTLVLALVTKSIFFPISLAEVLLTVPVLGYEAYKLFLQSKKPDPIVLNDEVKKDLELLKGRLSAMNMEKNLKPENKKYF